jgi:hypothetical protein
LYKKKLILTVETGFNDSPLLFDLGNKKNINLHFATNPPVILKPSISYYGVTLGVGFKLPLYLLSTNKFTKTTYFDIGLKFSIKKRIFFGIRFKYYKGFTLLNQGNYDQYGDIHSNNGFYPNLNTSEFNLNMRYFFFKKYDFKAAQGIQGKYKGNAWSPYIYGYLGGYGVGNNQVAIMPFFFQDSLNEISKARTISSFEIGAIPGVAGVLKKGIFQANLFGGLGPMIQAKNFNAGKVTRGFLGFNLRTDLGTSFGIEKDKWFLLLKADFQYRRIKINQIAFNQFFYEARLLAGFRIEVKTPKGILKMEAKKAKKNKS